MILKHVALAASSEKNSDEFYGSLLGLKKRDSKMLSASLSKQIFKVDAESRIVNYASDRIHFEIFINNKNSQNNENYEHVCLLVEDLAAFLKKCRDMDFKILQIPKGETMLTFIKDHDGNLFEIK